jgi:hypothetical protein
VTSAVGKLLAAEACIRIDVGDGVSRTGRRALRVTTTKVTFDYLASRLRVIDSAKRTGNGADLAADTLVVGNNLGAGRKIDTDGVNRAGTHAPGFIALGTGVGRKSPFMVESENLDIRSRWVKSAGVLIGTGHFALETAGTLARIDVEGFLHCILRLCRYYHPRQQAAFLLPREFLKSVRKSTTLDDGFIVLNVKFHQLSHPDRYQLQKISR